MLISYLYYHLMPNLPPKDCSQTNTSHFLVKLAKLIESLSDMASSSKSIILKDSAEMDILWPLHRILNVVAEALELTWISHNREKFTDILRCTIKEPHGASALTGPSTSALEALRIIVDASHFLGVAEGKQKRRRILK